jgi:hypothetical protein
MINERLMIPPENNLRSYNDLICVFCSTMFVCSFFLLFMLEEINKEFNSTMITMSR